VSISIRSDAGKLGKSMRGLARKHPQTVRVATREVAVEAQTLFERTVHTWTNPPQFTIEEARGTFRVGTDDPRYKWVDEGTRPHEIRPRRASVLRFTGPYQPKTKPGVLASYAGGRGRIVIWAQRVMHPGTEARGFSTIIRERVQATAANVVRAALRVLYAGEGFGP